MKQTTLKSVVMVLVTLVALNANAYDVEIDGIYYNLYTQEAFVTHGDNKYIGEVTIPSSITSEGVTYAVIGIEEYAFHDCGELTSVTIPNSVVHIPQNAFSYFETFSSLTSLVVQEGNPAYDSRGNCNAIIETESNTLMVGCQNTEIPNSVTSIGYMAFAYCSGLTSVTIPNSVTTIGDIAFGACHGLTSVTIGNGVTSIGRGAFSGCRNLPSVTIPGNVKTIGDETFNSCSSLTSVNILDGVKSIGWAAFCDCDKLTSVTIPNSVTTISGEAFYRCSGLVSVTISSNVASIEENAFGQCYNLASVIIPDGVKSIGKWAFSSCRSLLSVTIPNSVTTIGEEAFCSCRSLTSVTIPEGVTSIGEGIFANCGCITSLSVHENNLTYDSRDNCNAIIETSTNTLIAGCKNTTIPNSVTSIGDSAFQYCSNLTSLTIPNSVTEIGDYAFQGCSGLISLTIPNSVISIGEGALSSCSGLISISIPNSVTSIGDLVFSYCSGLISMTIPNSVASIGNYVFYGCSGLTSVTCHATQVPTTDDKTFYNCDLTNATLYVPNESFETYSSTEPWSLFGTIKPISSGGESENIAFADETVKALCVGNWDTNGDGELSEDEAAAVTSLGEVFKETGITSFDELQYFTGLTSIEESAFYDCTSLTSVTIPNSVITIGYSAFSGCSSLTSFTIPNSVTSIDNYAFDGCSLSTISIPSSVTNIGNYAFRNCGSLNSLIVQEGNPIYDSRGNCNAIIETASNTLIAGCQNTKIPNNVTGLGMHAFADCSGLISIDIPNSVTSIGNSAFSGCSDLASVTIPNSVINIGNSAFNNCSGLSTVVIPNNVTSIGSNAFAGCSGLVSLVVQEGNPIYDSRGNCNAVIETASNTLIAGCQNTEIPNSVTSIGKNAFYRCSSLSAINIPNSVTVIGNYAFSGCSNLTSVTIGNNVDIIGNSAFARCSGLTSIAIPNSVKSIGSMAFDRCTGLTSMTCYPIEVPSTMTGAFRFVDLANVTLYVPESSLEAYRETTPWNTFGHIVAIPESNLELELANGWNWISHNVVNSLTPTEVFGENVVEVKSQTKGLVRDTQYGIVGNLKELIATEAYKVKTTEADTEPYVLTGDLFDAEANATYLKQGWNWIGYPMANEESVEDALKGFTPMEGDYLVGQEDFTFYSDGAWNGTFVLTPGKGYMYKSGETKAVHFSKASEAKTREAKARREENESQWTCDIHKYPNRMPAIARLYIKEVEADASDYDVAAFCGDECRGVGKVVKGVVMMNVCGEGSETITFKAIDKKSGIVMDINESVSFTGDVLGAYTEPFKLTLNGESITGIATIKSETAVDAIYNLSGQRISSDKQTLPKGVYIYQGKKVMIK